MSLPEPHFDVSTTPVSPAALPDEARRSAQAFVLHEARLLDERRFAQWLDLWDANGRYWVPRFHDQADPYGQISLFWEDRMLREVRVARIENARNWSQQPVTRSAHVMGGTTIEGLDAAGHLIVRTSFQVTEWRLELRQLAGAAFHKLSGSPAAGWKIMLKRVDLVNCDAAFGNLEMFL